MRKEANMHMIITQFEESIIQKAQGKVRHGFFKEMILELSLKNCAEDLTEQK